MNPKYRRLIVVILILSTLGLATKLILMALKDNIIYFYSPNDLKLKYGKIENIKNVIRVGGLVLEESVKIKGNKTIFEITDRTHQIKVSFDGSLPDLFREGQGIVVEGEFIDNKLIANQVLAKHDENYMPPEVADALMRNGVWQGGKKN
jgi:cytochrome c-type biogenesis protein CcmE